MTSAEVICLRRLAVLDLIMERQFIAGKTLTRSGAETKEEFFGFRSKDIVGVHRRKYDVPSVGLFFRLRDGRVVDTFRHEHDPDPLLYDHLVKWSYA